MLKGHLGIPRIPTISDVTLRSWRNSSRFMLRISTYFWVMLVNIPEPWSIWVSLTCHVWMVCVSTWVSLATSNTTGRYWNGAPCCPCHPWWWYVFACIIRGSFFQASVVKYGSPNWSCLLEFRTPESPTISNNVLGILRFCKQLQYESLILVRVLVRDFTPWIDGNHREPMF
jgi:hypothetical protein